MGMMINRRRVCGGKLPYDAEIEYLESDGNQQIMTNFIVDNTIDIDTSVMLFDLYKQSSICFSFNEEHKTCFGIFNSKNTNTKLQFFFGNNKVAQLPTPLFNTKYKISTDNNILYINNAYIATVTYNTFVGSTPLGLLQNNLSATQARLRMYYFKATTDNDSIDLIPVRIGQVGYMYDKVSGTLFGNSGTGAFILGPDK